MFKPLEMGINHMLGIDGYVPIMKQNFEVRIFNMDGSSPTESSDALTLSTNTVGAINENQEAIEVHYGNGVIKFPNKVQFDDVEWNLNCFCEPNILDELRAWRKQIYDANTEKMGLPSQYMRNVYFLRYDGQGNVREGIRCPGTWIKGLNSGDYDQSGGLVQVSCQFVISRAIYLTKSDLA